jgi:pteridine reductase
VSDLPLSNKTILVTGAAKRIGRAFAEACASAGADVVIHYGHSERDALDLRDKIMSLGRRAWVIQADLSRHEEVSDMIQRASANSPLYGLVNSAAIFKSLSLQETSPIEWEGHIAVNLTAPFLLSQAFAAQVADGGEGRIVNILDWRALRPGADHFSYTISKAALAAMTQALAASLAPKISVNGLALGAILPPSDKSAAADILKSIPAGRWGQLSEIAEALIFLLSGPAYITGEIIHVDGGRHLV